MDVKNEGGNLWRGQSSFSLHPTSSMPPSLRQDVSPLPRWGMQRLPSPYGALPQKQESTRDAYGLGQGLS